MTDIELLSNLKAEGGLFITHNPHKANYQTVEEYEKEMALFGSEYSKQWITEEERSKGIRLNEMWELVVYPYDPTIYYPYLASSLDAILIHLREIEKRRIEHFQGEENEPES